MIEFVEGDFFDYEADIRVNTVNCVGVMGAGVALAFKEKYPDMFKEYASLCRKEEIEIGKPHVWSSGDLFSKSLTIINFPTKIHWRNKSEYEYIEQGLIWLKEYLKDKKNMTLSLPALGCGHGGLDWEIVKKKIHFYLDDSPTEILVFEPSVSKSITKNSLISSELKLELKKNNIEILNYKDSNYPISLKRFSEKTLYFKGKLSNLSNKTITLISSTKPEEKEKIIIEDFLNFIQNDNFNIILGNSAYDKKTIKSLNTQKVSMMLPSGLQIFCKKNVNKEICNNKDILFISMGNPSIEFDKKEYITSIFTRIYLSDVVLFTTPKLDWIKKHEKKFLKYNGKQFFINYQELSNNVKNDLSALSIKQISRDKKTSLPKFDLVIS